jgi:hypothetical protein
MKIGDTVEVTTKVLTTHWHPIPGESRRRREDIPPGAVSVGELLMNYRDGIKIRTDGDIRDFKRKDVRIKILKVMGL